MLEKKGTPFNQRESIDMCNICFGRFLLQELDDGRENDGGMGTVCERYKDSFNCTSGFSIIVEWIGFEQEI